MREYPRKFIYGRVFRVKLKNYQTSKGLLNVWFYEYGLKAIENGKIKLHHINALSRLVKRTFKKELSIRYNISLITPVTKKPTEIRMGKGKGQRHHWEFNVKKGLVLLEVGGMVSSKDKLFRCLSLIQEKLPLHTKIVKLTY